MNAPQPPAASPPPLVWPNGQLMRSAELAREVAAPRMASVRSILTGHPAVGLDPRRLAQLLRQAEEGDAVSYLELAEEMEEKDPHYLSVLGTRKRAVAQLPIEVEAASDAPEHQEDAELIRAWLKRDMLEAEIFDMLDAIGKGFSVTEMIWRTRPGKWLPADLKWRDPRFFEFDRVNGETVFLRGSAGPEPLSAAKFIVHFHKAKSGLPIRGGIARVVAWGWMFKNFSIKDWVSFLETYGMPLRIGRYDNGETEANIGILARAVADLGSDAAAVFPKTMEVQFVDAKAGSAPGDLWRSMAEYIDDQVSKAVLGQTNTTDAKAGGLGSGQADVHNEVRKDIRDADAKLLAATLNRDLVVPIIMLNRGPRADDAYPRITIGAPDPVDVKAMVEAAAVLVPLGVKIGARQLREKAGLPEPEAGEDVLAIAGPTATPENAPESPSRGADVGLPGSRVARPLLDPLKSPTAAFHSARAGAEDGRAPDPVGLAADSAPSDPIDRAAEAALDDWAMLMEPVIAPIEAMLATASSLEEARDRLAGVIGRMDVNQLATVMARAGFAMRLAGDADQQRVEREAAQGDG
jgi:phage gp29-like protein